MANPSKNWSDIQDGQIDAESPLDTTLLTQIRDNLVYLKEWLGGSYTAQVDHDHDGVNSKTLRDNSVTGDKINKTHTETAQSIPANATFTPSAGVYQLMPESAAADGFRIERYIAGSWQGSGTIGAGECTGVYIFDGSNQKIRNLSSTNTRVIYLWKY